MDLAVLAVSPLVSLDSAWLVVDELAELAVALVSAWLVATFSAAKVLADDWPLDVVGSDVDPDGAEAPEYEKEPTVPAGGVFVGATSGAGREAIDGRFTDVMGTGKLP